MPWTAEDSYRHTHKARTPKKRRMWARVANAILSRGGSEASAIKQANSVVRAGVKKKKRALLGET